MIVLSKKLIYLLLISIISFVSIANSDNEEYLFSDRYDIIPKERNKIINKKIYLKPDIKTNFYIRINSFPDRDTLIVLFHGGKNSAVEFMQNTNLHGRIVEEGYDFLLVPSYGSKDYISEYKNNEVVMNSIMRELNSHYRKIVFLGYAEGATYMTKYYCNNQDKSETRRVMYIWNINGTIPKDCQINNNVNYNILYGTKMELSNYYSKDDYYTDYGELSSYLAGTCSIDGYSVNHGSSSNDVYLEQAVLGCNEENNVNIFRAINMERNFPYTNKLEMIGFKGDEIPNFDMVNFIKKINYL